MLDSTDIRRIVGQDLHTTDGAKVGKIGQVYLDDETGAPEWVTVNTGLFGTRESFVPLADARTGEGGDVVVPYTKDQIKDAPSVTSEGHLSEDEERRLYQHYDLDRIGGERYTDTDEAGTVGRDTSGPTTDRAMTRSEERLDVGTKRVETGKARLRKWIETEDVQVEVPVSRERARLVTEPITDANRDAAYDGPDISEEEHEVTLTEERPVVSKETVPVERVRLDTEVETATETVDGTVRKERIELEGDVEETGGKHRRG